MGFRSTGMCIFNVFIRLSEGIICKCEVYKVSVYTEITSQKQDWPVSGQQQTNNRTNSSKQKP